MLMKEKMVRMGALVLCVVLACALLLTGCAGGVAVQPGETVACMAFSGESSKTYKLAGALTLDCSDDAAAAAAFNRIALEYELSAPVRCVMHYAAADGRTVQEEFYLSETQNTFSQLIDGYLDGAQAQRLERITVEPLLEGEYTLKLKSAALAVQEVLPEVLTIENDHYILGVDLSMGGGISRLEDKKCPRDDIGNLLNHHDTGRLIQQSYYGVSSHPDYENGSYNGNVWPYNPVQGGDLHNNCSKIVAVEYTDTAITVVSRPLDWALDNVPTYAYYTNTYTMLDELVRVDNTVIDFSGFPNPSHSQELPAFYTISALGNFVYYGGEQPWTGDSLTYQKKLKFWGGNPDGSFSLSPDNSECWCAWVDEKDYGVGLYTPNVEMLVAGRYRYNGDTRSNADPTNYVAPVAYLALRSYEPISYSYLIGAGTVEQLREAFTANKDFAANADLRQTMDARYDFANMHFESEADLAYFGASNQTQLAYENGSAVLTATQTAGADPYIALRYAENSVELYAQEYPYLVMTYRTAPDNSALAGTVELFLSADVVRSATAGFSAYHSLQNDGALHSDIIHLGENAFWDGRINEIRLDYFAQAEQGDTLYLYSMVLAENEAEAQKIASAQLKAAEKTLK